MPNLKPIQIRVEANFSSGEYIVLPFQYIGGAYRRLDQDAMLVDTPEEAEEAKRALAIKYTDAGYPVNIL